MMIMKMVTFNNDGGGFEEDEYITCKEIVDHDGVILTMMIDCIVMVVMRIVIMMITMMVTVRGHRQVIRMVDIKGQP